ncbi:MAG: hypothetical protein U5K79_06080 [Cyclobacteriaceae bacterium]|nr:hypothetical protein [Cyclobacteriaceae bacterium]
MFSRITPMVRNLLIINIGLYFISSLMRLDINAIGSLRNVNSDYFNHISTSPTCFCMVAPCTF